MTNRKHEPSMGMVKRMAAAQPDQLVEEIARLRSERDNLRDALAFKLSEYVTTLGITKDCILKIRKPMGMSVDLIEEVLEVLARRLMERHGWSGLIVTEDKMVLGNFAEPEARALYENLRKRFGGTDAKH